MTPGSSTSPSHRLRILLIEDDEADVYLVKEILANRDPGDGISFEVEWAKCLADGEKILKDKKNPDVVLLDLTLPDATGLEGLNRLQACSQQVPIVILSNMTDEDTAVNAVREGAQDFLVKSGVEAMRLSRIIRYAVERKKAEIRRSAKP